MVEPVEHLSNAVLLRRVGRNKFLDDAMFLAEVGKKVVFEFEPIVRS